MCKFCLRFISGIIWLFIGGSSVCYLGVRFVEGIYYGFGLFDVVFDLY